MTVSYVRRTLRETKNNSGGEIRLKEKLHFWLRYYVKEKLNLLLLFIDIILFHYLI